MTKLSTRKEDMNLRFSVDIIKVNSFNIYYKTRNLFLRTRSILKYRAVLDISWWIIVTPSLLKLLMNKKLDQLR